ncbi:MAG: hypothetical protein AAB448_02445 [Patescibacteria group bacterium]
MNSLSISTSTSSTQAESFSYPFHLPLTVDVPMNAVSHILGDVWGVAVVDRATGAISGTGIVRYVGDTTCAWTPPSPTEGVSPYCEVLALKSGTFFIEGSVKEYTESRYSNDLSEIDQHIFASADTWGFEDAEWLPRVLELNFAYGETPMEQVLLSGLTGGNVEEKALGGLAMGLNAAGFVQPFIITPIAAEQFFKTPSPDAQEASRYEFSGTNQIATAKGTLLFSQSLPPGLTW